MKKPMSDDWKKITVRREEVVVPDKPMSVDTILDDLLGDKAPDFIPYYDPRDSIESKANREFQVKWVGLRDEAKSALHQLMNEVIGSEDVFGGKKSISEDEWNDYLTRENLRQEQHERADKLFGGKEE